MQVVEASNFVFRGKRFGYIASLLFSSFFLIAAPSSAQSGSDAPPAATQQPAGQAPAQPETQQQPIQSLPAQTPAQRAQVLREAQARVSTRRQQKIAQLVQQTYSHKFEAYFGGGYLRFHPGDHLQRINEADWNVGVTDYIRPKLGLTADFRGYYGTAYTGNNSSGSFGIFAPSISQYTFMFGPQYRLYQKPRLAVSAQLLAGAGHGNFDTGTGGLPGSLIGLYSNGTVFNISAGVPVDYNVSPGLALRLTPLYLFSNYGGSTQNNLGFNAGVVYRWGKQ